MALHIIAVTLRALPAPGNAAMNKSAWQAVTVQRELSAWNGRINKLGISMSDAEFQEHLWRFSVAFMRARGEVLAPFDWYYMYFGTWQSWRMFVAPDTHPSRWQLRIREHGEWRTIYEERSPLYTFKRRLFDNVQMRYAMFLFGWAQHPQDYADFADWVFKQVKINFPQADMVESRFLTYDTPSPAQVREHVSVPTTIHGTITRELK